jgi:hypothetical protein
MVNENPSQQLGGSVGRKIGEKKSSGKNQVSYLSYVDLDVRNAGTFDRFMSFRGDAFDENDTFVSQTGSPFDHLLGYFLRGNR